MITLFIGRFQPFHNGHLNDLESAAKFSTDLKIAIGSSNASGTKDNPFSFEERKAMIEHVLKKNNIAASIYAIPDINDDTKWVEHVRSIVGDFDTAYTGNHWVKKLFQTARFEVKDVIFLQDINATEIRNRICSSGNWQELVPNEIAEYIHKIGGINRIKQINRKL